jgi:hypothetical protein
MKGIKFSDTTRRFYRILTLDMMSRVTHIKNCNIDILYEQGTTLFKLLFQKCPQREKHGIYISSLRLPSVRDICFIFVPVKFPCS